MHALIQSSPGSRSFTWLRLTRTLAWLGGFAVSLVTAATQAAAIPDDCIRNDDPKLAIEACTMSIESGDEGAEPYFYRGLHYAAAGDKQSAMADFTKAIEIDPSYPDALAERARLNSEAGHVDLSLADANQAIFLDADNGLALETRGRILEFRGNKADALKDYHSALLADAKRAEAREGLRRLGAANINSPECRELERSLDDDEDAIKIVNCLTYDESGRPQTLEISSLKLDELATSALLNDWMPEDLAAQLGRQKDIVRTEVFDEISKISQMFSENDVGIITVDTIEFFAPGISWRASFGTAQFSEILLGLSRHGAINSGIRNIRYETAPSADVLSSLGTTGWPDTHNFWFGSAAAIVNLSGHSDKTPEPVWGALAFRKRWGLENTVIWRYMRRTELETFYQDQYRFQQFLEDSGSAPWGMSRDVPASISYGDRTFKMTGDFGVPKYIEAMKYFGRSEFPPDLGVVFSGLYDGSWETYFFPRHVILEVNLVRNTSDLPVEVRQLGFTRDYDLQIRRPADANAKVEGAPSAAAKSHDETWRIEPGRSLIVPVRITLEYDDAVKDAFAGDYARQAQKVFEQISGLKPDTKLEYHQYGTWLELLWSDPLLTKRASGFSAPVPPSLQPYVHDAELRLAYVETPKGRLWPDGFKPASVSFTVRQAGNQCPYLFAWSAQKHEFERLGRILVSANNDYQGQYQRIDLPTPTFRFKIAEREQEVSYIDQTQLEAKTRDGRTIWLSPDVEALQREDSVSEVLEQGDAVEFTFGLPTGVTETDIASAALHVRGRYDRYGKLLLQSQLQRRDKGARAPR